MITIKNNLNQPISVGDAHLGAGGTIETDTVTDEITRLANKGFVTVIKDAVPKAPPTPPTPPPAPPASDDQGTTTKKGENNK